MNKLKFADFDFHDESLEKITFDYINKQVILVISHYIESLGIDINVCLTFNNVSHYNSDSENLFQFECIDIFDISIKEIVGGMLECKIELLTGIGSPSFNLAIQFQDYSLVVQDI